VRSGWELRAEAGFSAFLPMGMGQRGGSIGASMGSVGGGWIYPWDEWLVVDSSRIGTAEIHFSKGATR
jgi:hypothetical protein